MFENLTSFRRRAKLLASAVVIIYLSSICLDLLEDNSLKGGIQLFGNHTLLVIAHPDDESMFFGPTIQNLVRSEKKISILCLSYDDTRKQELLSASRILSPQIRVLFADPALPDVENESWHLAEIRDSIRKAIKDSPTEIDGILTFDEHGVSGHLHHKSIYRAVIDFTSDIEMPSFKIFFLKSVFLVKKYLSILEANTYYMTSLIKFPKFFYNRRSIPLVINLDRYYVTRKALMQHRSQMVWFRILYLAFSRYMFINDIDMIM